MKYFNKTIEYGLYSLVFLLPSQTRWIIKTGELEYATYSLYGTDLLLIFVLLLCIIYRITNYKLQITNLIQNSKFKTKNLLTFGLFLASFVSVIFAIDKMLAFYKLGWLVLGLGLFWLVVSANYNRAKLVYALLAGIFFQAGLAVWQFLTQSSFASKWLGLAWHQGADLGASVIETVGSDGMGERWLRAYGGLDHPNVLGGVLAVGILLLIGIMNYELGIRDKRQSIKFHDIKFFASYFLLLTFSAALFFSFSRAAWLALAAGLALRLVGAAFKKNLPAQKNILQAVLVASLVGFILFFQFPNLVMTRVYGGARLEIKSAHERIESSKSAWPIIKNNWAGGVGLGNYVLALSRQAPGKESFYYQPAHNVYLLALSEIGVFGFVFFIGLIIYIIITNYQFLIIKFLNHSLKIENWKLKIRDNGSDDNAMVNSAVLVALIVIMFFDHWLWSLHFGVLFFWLVLGLMVRDDKKMISI